jgi:hypothetical protein
MRLLLDTDAFCKLWLGGLLPDVLGLFEAELADCGRLPALPHMLRKGRLRTSFGAGACDAMLAVAEAVPNVPQPGETWLDRLTPVPAIDPGEAQLFALAAERRLLIVSGDKRALRALRTVAGFPAALAGRIVVVEALIFALCDRVGLEVVRERVQPLMASDRVVQVCFSDRRTDPRAALRSYLDSLEAEVRPLVLWKPE